MAANATSSVADILPIPGNMQTMTDPDREEKHTSLADQPTVSHALATSDHKDKGVAQQNYEESVVDLGWKAAKEDVPEPLVGRLPNEELWVLVRRFNKVQSYEGDCRY
jgi:hypothetical protein